MPISKRRLIGAIPLVLALLIAIGYYVLAIDSFPRAPHRTFDEAVYHQLAIQLKDDLYDYNTFQFVLENTGPPLPEYFSRPLFKHPPLFSYLLLITQSFFGSEYTDSAIVPAFFGAATILLVYRLGKMIYNRWVGVASALLLALNPIHIICGQKLWPATTMSFFMVGAAVLTLLAVKRKQPIILLLASAAIGCAVLTKYPGIFMLPLLAIPAWLMKPGWKIFSAFLLIPFIFLVPWIQWNLEIYGPEFLSNSVFIHFSSRHRENPMLILAILGMGAALFGIAGWFWYSKKILRVVANFRMVPPQDKFRLAMAFWDIWMVPSPFLRWAQLVVFSVNRLEIRILFGRPNLFRLRAFINIQPNHDRCISWPSMDQNSTARRQVPRFADFDSYRILYLLGQFPMPLYPSDRPFVGSIGLARLLASLQN